MIRILIDENLPASLTAKLPHSCVHATALGERMSDNQLWEYAMQHDCIILTKDADFFEHLVLKGPPPKIIWLRTGNLRRSDLEAMLIKRWPVIETHLATADLIEIFAERIECINFPRIA